MSDTELMKFFDFDQSDLIANQHGRLSANQENRIKETDQSTSKIFRGIGIALILLNLCIVVIFSFIAIEDGLSFDATSGSDIFGFILALAFPTLIIGVFVWMMFWLASSKTDHSLQKVEGEVNFVKVEKRKPHKTGNSMSYRTVQEYEMRVGKVKFEDVNEELLNIIEEGNSYIFYYTKDNKDILSCEFVSKGE